MRKEEVARKDIGNMIYQFRNSMEITRIKFMSDIGDIPVSLPNIENGRSLPTLDFLVAVSNRYRVAISDIIDTGFRQRIIPGVDIKSYEEKELYYILQRVSLEKYGELRNHEMHEFVSVDMKESNWSFMGNLLHNERLKGRFTYQYLMEKTGISLGTIRNIESGSNASSFQTWYQICSVLKMPLDYFLVNRLNYKQGAFAFLLEDIFGEITEEERTYLIKYMQLYADIYHKKRIIN